MLTKAGAHVHVMMTASATRFVTPLTFQTMSKNLVAVDVFDEPNPAVINHIALVEKADLVVVAPATANMIGKMANGIADDMVSTTLLVATCPVMLAPAMNTDMYNHPAVQANLQTLRTRGVQLVEPGEGLLACGVVGKGRLAEPEDIFQAIDQHFASDQPLRGRKVLITAGGTVERIDPVRYISNDSSGKMAFALAEWAYQLGAEVEVVAARTTAVEPEGVHISRAMSAAEMLDAVEQRRAEADIIIMAAAVADFRPTTTLENKFKKTSGALEIQLEPTTDILAQLGKAKKQNQLLVGFAAETENLAGYAMDKLSRKNCDLIIANQVSLPGVGFDKDTNAVEIYDASGLVREVPVASKLEVAKAIWQTLLERGGWRD
jgi:phosphopantothenoylcysteine decarboxylase/phosphopantothenate--cysteine ligase